MEESEEEEESDSRAMDGEEGVDDEEQSDQD